jgi:hypothetical protein
VNWNRAQQSPGSRLPWHLKFQKHELNVFSNPNSTSTLLLNSLLITINELTINISLIKKCGRKFKHICCNWYGRQQKIMGAGIVGTNVQVYFVCTLTIK